MTNDPSARLDPRLYSNQCGIETLFYVLFAQILDGASTRTNVELKLSKNPVDAAGARGPLLEPMWN